MAPVTLAFAAMLTLLTLASFCFGSTAERQVAVAYLVAYLLPNIVPHGSFDFDARTWLQLGVDCVLLVILEAVAIKTNRWWVIVSASLQILLMLGYFARWLDPSLSVTALWAVLTASSFPAMLLLAFGIAQSHRARRRCRSAAP